MARCCDISWGKVEDCSVDLLVVWCYGLLSLANTMKVRTESEREKYLQLCTVCCFDILRHHVVVLFILFLIPFLGVTDGKDLTLIIVNISLVPALA